MKNNKIIFVDFDGTICPNKDAEDYSCGYPAPTTDCIKALHALRASGHKIIIYSVRSNLKETSKPGGHDAMLQYLIFHNVPYDDIDTSKSHFRMVIDDKGLGVPLDKNKNVDWKKARKILEKRQYI